MTEPEHDNTDDRPLSEWLFTRRRPRRRRDRFTTTTSSTREQQ